MVNGQYLIGTYNDVTVCENAALTACTKKVLPNAPSDVWGITQVDDMLYIGTDDDVIYICNLGITVCTRADGGAGRFSSPSIVRLAPV